MKPIKLLLIFVVMCTITIVNMSVVSGHEEPNLKKLDDILTYCDTKSKMREMAKSDYHMHKGMAGLIHDQFYKELMSVELWLNPNNDTWAIVFFYKKQDLACIVGGNRAELFAPKDDGDSI
ncbi:MAG: hypothetical protein CMA31_03020 [Euryarchaeota archaeon]|nr:hypothetical protein [Euryarchaeota archaeon]